MSNDPRILVIGATGMAGHQAIRVLGSDLEVWGACRNADVLPDLGIPAERIVSGIDATDASAVDDLVRRLRPDFVINAVGIVKQLKDAKAAIPSITINSLWPHVLADICDTHGARMLHFSTDCVFSGDRGGYTEADVPDAFDLYGRSKLLGEVTDRENTLTIRTSIIGWQHGLQTGLVGWFAEHRHEPLLGYRKAVFSGVTTRVLAELIRDVIITDTSLHGLYNVAAEPIDKLTLLRDLAGFLGWDIDMTPVDEPAIDRSLDGTRFRERTGWVAPSWDDMLRQLAEDYPAGH